MTRFAFHLLEQDLIQRGQLLTRTIRVLLLIAIAGGLLIGSGWIRMQTADQIAAILMLLALILTGVCALASHRRGAFQLGALCFIIGSSLAISIAVWQFGRRIPETHLGYFIPIAIAAIFWGSRLSLLTALSVWGVNVWIVANQPESQGVYHSPNEIIGLLTLGASYAADAFVVGRFAENLAHAVSRAEEKAQQAAQAEKKAVESARQLEITLRAEQSHRQQLATLYALASRLAATAKAEDFLPLTTESIIASLRVTFATVALIEEDDNGGAPALVVASCYPCRDIGGNDESGSRFILRAMPTVAFALAQRECCVLQPADSKLNPLETQFLSADRMSSVAIVPIFVQERALGVLVLGETQAWERVPLSEDKLQLAQSIADLTAGAIQRSRLFDELEDAYVQTVLALAKAVEAKDTYTADHGERLADQAESVARKLGMSDPAELRALRFGAMLHDVGKIGVPDAVLKKPGKLDAEEWKLMKQHPVIGARILETVARLRAAAKIVRHHHERWDGTGYPDGLAREAIPLGARILTAIDSYSAIVDARVYKPARSHTEAVAELVRGAGAQFDPHVVKVFLEMLEPDQEMARHEGRTLPARALTPALLPPSFDAVNQMIASVDDRARLAL